MLRDTCLSREVSCPGGLGSEDFIGGEGDHNREMGARDNVAWGCCNRFIKMLSLNRV